MAAPRDRKRLAECLQQAVKVSDGPTVLRFPKGHPPADLKAAERTEGIDIMRQGSGEILLIAYGDMVTPACKAANALASDGLDITVVDPVWALPVSGALVQMAGKSSLVVTVEDNLVAGGLGQQLDLAMEDANFDVPIRHLGLPHAYIAAGAREEVLASLGLSETGIAESIRSFWEARQA